MTYRELFVLLIFGIFANSCGLNLNAPDDGNNGTDPDTTAFFRNATASNLPDGLSETSMKAKTGDIDNDGDLDLVVGLELQANKILINQGSGSFTDESSSRLPAQNFDTQDVTVADLNSDGNLDLFFASNQNQTNELFINNGNGSFSDLSNRIPVTGNSSSVESRDIDGDGSTDILIGNIGQNVILMNSGNAFFNNQTTQRLPQIVDPTRDIEFGDITGNSVPDIIVGNENANRILINTGSGFFNDQTSNRLIFINAIEETQDVNLVDVDSDSDLDIYFGNSGFQDGSDPQDRLLINNGQGFFSDQTADRLPSIITNTFDAEFADLDDDQDVDLIVGNYNGGIRVLINNGNGFFTNQTNAWIPENFTPLVTDLEVADFNNDDQPDIYISVRNGQDQLLLQREE
jgi:hypothetical protein